MVTDLLGGHLPLASICSRISFGWPRRTRFGFSPLPVATASARCPMPDRAGEIHARSRPSRGSPSWRPPAHRRRFAEGQRGHQSIPAKPRRQGPRRQTGDGGAGGTPADAAAFIKARGRDLGAGDQGSEHLAELGRDVPFPSTAAARSSAGAHAGSMDQT